jgi:phytanoyl-CoA dioxygenase PhyH
VQPPVSSLLTDCGTVYQRRRIAIVSRQDGLLTAERRESLERDGYLLVSSLLDETVLAPVRARLDEMVHQTLVAWDAGPGQDVEERGVVHATLGLSDPDFAPCREHPLLAEAAAAVLGPDWHLSGLELRAPLPGCGHQGLHPDYFPGHRTHGPWRSLSAMWCISAFTPENGPLRVIPGSHRAGQNPADALPPGCEMGPHPAEVKVVAPAGSVMQLQVRELVAVVVPQCRGVPEHAEDDGERPACHRQRPAGQPPAVH